MPFSFPPIPQGSILGLNYSGMHDSAIALVAPDGDLVFACALERLSRYKQDGRRPDRLLDGVPWSQIAAVALTTDQTLDRTPLAPSRLHPTPLKTPRTALENEHGQPFNDFVKTLPVPVHFVNHQLCHASAAFAPSGFDAALCLTYDGGMSNCTTFGGLFQASLAKGIVPLDTFPLATNARISVLYSFITGMLGFTPNKHEGKITGLAAYGHVTPACRALLDDWMGPAYHEIESLCDWYFMYDDTKQPQLAVNAERRRHLQEKIKDIKREDLAATVQTMTEEHILTLLTNARQAGWTHDNICLSGGLFSNVKLNQRVKAFGFSNIFISPPMTDDGTAYGAALHVLSQTKPLARNPQKTMAVGPAYDADAVLSALTEAGLTYTETTKEDQAEKIATLLAQGKAVALFSGGMEFGPRALGNRSILAAASDASINKSLNDKLNRTEFMPFAPMTRYEDKDACYTDLAGCDLTAEYMTITTGCTDLMKQRCPAVVHVDGTARPQLIRADKLPLVHRIITLFQEKTGQPSIVNTSFNIHEEPIVCSPRDAIDGFLGAGLDYLFFDAGPGYLLSFDDNRLAALTYLQSRRGEKSKKEEALTALNADLFRRIEILSAALDQAGETISHLQTQQAETSSAPLHAKFLKLVSRQSKG